MMGIDIGRGERQRSWNHCSHLEHWNENVSGWNGRPLIDRISDWPNPRGFTKGVCFVWLNRYIQVDKKPFGQSGSYGWNTWLGKNKFNLISEKFFLIIVELQEK